MRRKLLESDGPSTALRAVPPPPAIEGRVTSSLPHPHLIIVERGAAERRHRVGAGECVDAAAVGVSRIRPDRFGDQHAAAHAVEQLGVQAHLTAAVAEHDRIAVGDGERCGILRIDHHHRPAFPGQRGRRLGETRIEKAARRRGGQPKRMLGVGLLDHGPVVGQRRNVRSMIAVPAAERHGRPIRLEAELAVGIREALEIMRGGEIRLAVDPAVFFQFGERAPAGFAQAHVDQLARGHGEAGMARAEALAQRANHLVIGAALTGRLDELRPEQNVLAAAGGIKIVVLDEHGGRQDDVRDLGGVGHELLVHADEQILAGETALDHVLVRRDRDRIGVLDEERVDRPAALQRVGIAGEDGADARLVEHADRRIAQVGAFDHAVVEMKHARRCCGRRRRLRAARRR